MSVKRSRQRALTTSQNHFDSEYDRLMGKKNKKQSEDVKSKPPVDKEVLPGY